MKNLILTISLFCLIFQLQAQNNESSFVFIPIKVNKQEIKKLIDSSTPESIKVEDEGSEKRYDITMKVLDVKSELSGNNIAHNLRFLDGNGTYGQRKYYGKVLGKKHYSPWVTFKCKDIRANAKVNILTTITESYQINTNVSYSAKIDNAKCQGINVTSLLKVFGAHHLTDNISADINKELNKLPFKEQVEKIWKDIQKPISIDSSTYLLLNPIKLVYKDFSFDDENLNLGVGLTFLAKTGNLEESNNWNPNLSLPNLKKISVLPQNNIDLNIPLNIEHKTIENLAKKKLIGQFIIAKNKKGKEKKYARILDVSIDNSDLDKYELKLGLKVKIIKPFFKRKKGFIYLHSSIKFNKEDEVVFVDNFKIDAQTGSWFANNSIEVLSNLIAYNSLKKKMKFDLDKKIDIEKNKINEILKNKLEVSKDVKLSGVINDFEITNMKALENKILIELLLKGNINVKIISLNK